MIALVFLILKKNGFFRSVLRYGFFDFLLNTLDKIKFITQFLAIKIIAHNAKSKAIISKKEIFI